MLMWSPVRTKADYQQASEMVTPKQKFPHCTRRQFICQCQCYLNLGLSLPSVGCTIHSATAVVLRRRCVYNHRCPSDSGRGFVKSRYGEGIIVLRNTTMCLLHLSKPLRHTTTTSLLINAPPTPNNEKQRRPRPHNPRLRSTRLHSLHLHRPLRHRPAPPDPRLLNERIILLVQVIVLAGLVRKLREQRLE
jgi:hypothetical protein